MRITIEIFIQIIDILYFQKFQKWAIFKNLTSLQHNSLSSCSRKGDTAFANRLWQRKKSFSFTLGNYRIYSNRIPRVLFHFDTQTRVVLEVRVVLEARVVLNEKGKFWQVFEKLNVYFHAQPSKPAHFQISSSIIISSWLKSSDWNSFRLLRTFIACGGTIKAPTTLLHIPSLAKKLICWIPGLYIVHGLY